MPALESAAGFELRRPDLAAWHLLDRRVVGADAVRTPERIAYEDLARVHPFEWIASFDDPERLSRVFGLQRGEVRVGEVVAAIRLACGATLDAARESLNTLVPALSLAGGFHHAAPTRAAGFCLFNDVAVALARLRADGFSGPAVVIDLDAHPPDGTAECLADDPHAWIGSLSGSDWGPLQGRPGGVDETLLSPGSGDEVYLAALRALLARMPRPVELAFVIAGGDVLQGDKLGQLALTLDGARRRDLLVARALGRVPQVWLPGGGYSDRAWRTLAGTGYALACRTRRPIPDAEDPMAGRYARIALGLDRKLLGGELDLSDELDVALGVRRPATPRLLGYYTAEGLEVALERLGILGAIRRLGYADLTVEVEAADGDDLLRVRGEFGRKRHLLAEAAVSRRVVHGAPSLYLNWLTLRHPASLFTPARPRLPGQDAPGLGLLAEFMHFLSRVALRLDLAAVAFRPSSYHAAYLARHHGRFADGRRQGRFLALLRDLGDLPLPQATKAVDEGRVRCEGTPYAWEADDMVLWVGQHPAMSDIGHDDDVVEDEKARVHFTVEARPAPVGGAAEPW